MILKVCLTNIWKHTEKNKMKLKLSELRCLIKETILDMFNTDIGEVLEVDADQLQDMARVARGAGLTNSLIGAAFKA